MATPPQRASQQARSARFSRRPPSFAVTLLALGIIFALAWMFFLRSGPSASAPVVAGLQGTYQWRVTTSDGETGWDGAFSAVRSGNAGGTAESPTGQVASSVSPPRSAYDAATRTESTHSGTGPNDEYRRVIGEWPPAWQIATRSPLDYQGLAAVVRTAVEDGDETVGIKPIKDGDRAVWRASMRLGGEQVDVVVDQQTGVVTWYSAGDETFTADVAWGSPPPARRTFTVDVPAGTEVETVTSAPKYAATPADAGDLAGYDPLASGLAPDGYALKATATVPVELRPVSWIDEGPWSLPVGLPGTAILQLHTRGLSQFTVEQVGPSTMRALADLPGWQLEAGRDKLSFQETTLQYGAFKGETALTWYQESGPSLLVAGERRAVFVTGALTRQELVAFAEGLKPVPREQ